LLSTNTNDGRINSSIDETIILNLINKKFDGKVKIPSIRMWYDMLVFDYLHGWIPVNIKTTTTISYDNVGNLALCVYSYTNELLDIHRNKTYDNREMSIILYNKLKNKNYNRNYKKDYYFIVINKTNNCDIIINSVKGLTTLTANLNNLPFQICWDKNREYNYKKIDKNIEMFLSCLKKPTPNWKETFMTNIRTLTI
jgi:hypothetical protein